MVVHYTSIYDVRRNVKSDMAITLSAVKYYISFQLMMGCPSIRKATVPLKILPPNNKPIAELAI
jgi:hypothetical protein